jgi:molybdopterin molybdotransferase
MRPGKPLAFGEFQNVPFIGLPGNPVSAFVGFNIFVRPALMKMSGEDFITYPLQKAKLKHSVESDGRESYIPANLSQADDEWVVEPAVNQSSGNLFALIPGNSLIIVPNSVKFLSKGELVSVLKLDPA